MRITADQLEKCLSWPELIEALHVQFSEGCEVPNRHHHTILAPGQTDATMLLMPAWQPGKRIGVKLVNVFPDNTKRNLPSISADYLLYDGETGRALASMDGNTITSRRTAAAAALGANFLAREDSSSLFLVGAGRVASLIPEAMRSVRPIQQVSVWDIRPDGAEALCVKLRKAGFEADVQNDLHTGCMAADIISCATLSTKPLILGEWLKPGQHLDLIGSFTPEMRETDDDAMRKADIYIDTETAVTESGDLVLPLQSEVITNGSVRGTLTDLCRGIVEGRSSPEAITLFKAVGTALEDLAAASLAYDYFQANSDS